MGEFRFLFTARDYDATVAFYTETMGLPVAHSWDDHGRGTIVQAAAGQIEVFAAEGDDIPPPVNGAAIAFEVDDADAIHARLAAKGATTLSVPADQPWAHRSFSIQAPDGLVITLFQVLGPEGQE